MQLKAALSIVFAAFFASVWILNSQDMPDEAAPAPAAAPQPEAPAVDPKPESAPAPAAESKPEAPVVEPKPEAAPIPVAEPKVEAPAAEPKPEIPVAEPKSESAPTPAAESKPETPVIEPKPETSAAESKSEAPALEPKPKAAPGPFADPAADKPAVESKPAVSSAPEAKPEAPEGFEIDRNGAAAKESLPKSAKKDRAVVEAADKTMAAGEPQRRSFWGKLFGSSKKAGEVSAVATGAQAEAASQPMTPEQILAAQEEVRRQAKEVQGLKKLDQAYQEMSRNEFESALIHFNEGLTMMPVRPHTVETRQKAMMAEAQCEYRIALKNYQDGKVKEAKEGIRRALEYYPGHRASARLSDDIRTEEERRIRKQSLPVALKKSPEFIDKQKRIKEEIRRGREYEAMQEYDKAEAEFNSVLIEDRLNPEATAHLKKINDKRYNLETDEFERMKSEMLAQIRDTWTPPVKQVIAGPKKTFEGGTERSPVRLRLIEKLNNIMIPEINFTEATIVDVIQYLHQQSIAGDKDSIPGEKGVNILLNMKRPDSAAAPAAAAQSEQSTDLFAVEGASSSAGAADRSNIPRITLSVRNISLMEALKYITEFTGLKYRIEERAVVIIPSNVAYGELETRIYKIQPSMVETLMQGSSQQPSSGTEQLELGSTGPVRAERADMKQFFVNAGIPFPEGTSIVYIPSQTQLIVKNTAEHLENFERLLGKLNIPPVQVEIEARFVEIGQNDLTELGLEWLLTDNWELAEKQSGLPPSMRERIQMNKTTFTKGLRNLTTSGGQITTAAGGSMGAIASISSILTNPELSVILHALEQKDGVNLLSAPKVTTKSGAAAEIKVVEELTYPTEYQQQAQSLGTTAGQNQSIVQVIVTPSAFETRDLGVILQVTPTVGPDQETIDLAMVPQVVELSRWIDYGSDIPTGDATRTPQHLTLNQPVFHSRSITTSISIWDGQTVVMGGLITEGQQNTEDKVPLLGDIPLLGYLFRSKTTHSIKKNLLIFVTANLVDPAGNKVKGKDAVAVSSGASDTATP